MKERNTHNQPKGMIIMPTTCKIQLEISKIQLLTGSGADEIIIYANNVENGCYPFKGEQTLKMIVASNTGKSWIKKNFGDDVYALTEIINI